MLTVGGHAAVDAFLKAASLASVTTVATDGTVTRILTTVRTVT